MRRGKIIISVLLAVLMSASVCGTASAANSSGVNLYTAAKNTSGDGYYWNNKESTLTLKNFEVYTDDEFGLKIPENAKVVLEGESYIKAGKYGIGIPSGAVFSGPGSITIDAGEDGIFVYGTNGNKKVRFDSGTYRIKAGICGIRSEKESISLTGCTMDIAADEDYSVCCRELVMKKSTFSSTSPVFAKEKMEIVSSVLDISASAQALQSGGNITFERMKILGKEGKESEEYSGENVIRTEALKDRMRRSILFGEDYPIICDIIIFAAVIAAVVLLIVVPVVRKRRKVKKMYEELDKSSGKQQVRRK